MLCYGKQSVSLAASLDKLFKARRRVTIPALGDQYWYMIHYRFNIDSLSSCRWVFSLISADIQRGVTFGQIISERVAMPVCSLFVRNYVGDKWGIITFSTITCGRSLSDVTFTRFGFY